MPEHVAILRLTGVTVLAAATALWIVCLMRILRRRRYATAVRRPGRTTHRSLPTAPDLRETGTRPESVELSPAEQAAFAGLVRQLSDGR